MSMKRKIKAKAVVMLAMLAAASLFAGCDKEAEGGDNRVVVEQEAEQVEYKLTPVVRGDVLKKAAVRCVYSQIDSQKVSFDVSGKVITKVYVKKGDNVKSGDLLAELSGGGREAEIEELEYRIARNKLLLEQLDESENYELSRRWLERNYNGRQWEVDGIEDYLKNNTYTREDLNDAISLDEQKLALIRQDVRQSKVYARMDGSVSNLKSGLEGSTSVRDEVVMEIMNSEDCVFVMSDMKYADCVKPGQRLELAVMVGTGAGNYIVEPVDMDKWDQEAYFTVISGGDNAVLEAGNAGNISLILDGKEDVLTLPTAAVHDADGKWYVYIVGSNGAREVKWIEVGLAGNDSVEIVSGLAEGEKVILK